MAKVFLGKYFPPSMVTKLKNKITNFRQRPDESLFKAWERYELLIDRCRNQGMLPVTQIDTFYNGLTLRHRDTINAAAGGTFMKRCPKECYDLIENMTAHHNDWDTSAQRSESSSCITSSSNQEIVAQKAEMAEINKNLIKPPLAKPIMYMLQEPTMVTPTNLKIETHVPNFKPVVAPVIELVVAPIGRALIDVFEGELTLRVGTEAITFNLDQTSRYPANYNDMTANQIDVIDMACEEYSQEFSVSLM
nr:reverse transcriptase domain-containing protein [Tanacetum cinerariifolium]